jgi:hypothetical protein
MLAVLLLAAAATEAQAVDTKAPHRVAIERIAVAADPATASACAARALSRKGRVTSYSLPDGFGLDYAIEMPIKLYSGGPSYMTYEFRKDEAGVFARVLYRRPFNAAAVIGAFRDTARICFPADWNAWAATNGGKVVPAPIRPSGVE